MLGPALAWKLVASLECRAPAHLLALALVSLFLGVLLARDSCFRTGPCVHAGCWELGLLPWGVVEVMFLYFSIASSSRMLSEMNRGPD